MIFASILSAAQAGCRPPASDDLRRSRPRCLITLAHTGQASNAFTHQDTLLRMLSSIKHLAADATSVTIFAVLSSAQDADAFCNNSGHPSLTDGVQALSLEELLVQHGRGMTLRELQEKSERAQGDIWTSKSCAAAIEAKRIPPTLKKMLGAVEAHARGCDQAWVLDSESQAIRPFAFRDIFDRYFETPRSLIWNHSHHWSATPREWGSGFHSFLKTLKWTGCAAAAFGLTGTVGGQVDISEATLGRVGFELGGYRSTDLWLWSLSHIKGLIARVEAIHGVPFPEAVIKFATGADMFFGVYVDHVLPAAERPMRVVIPDAFSHVPSQLKRTLVAEPDLWMWRKSSANAMRSKAKMLSSRPLGWIAGWRFDRIRSVADRGAAMQLLASAPHITWAVSNFNLYFCNLFCENWKRVLNVSYIAPDGTVDYASNARPRQMLRAAKRMTPSKLVERVGPAPLSSAAASCDSIQVHYRTERPSSTGAVEFCVAFPGVHAASFLSGWHELLVAYAVQRPRSALRHAGLLVDIGANAGLFSVLALGANYSRVISVEPQPVCAKNLYYTKRHNRAALQEAGLEWRILQAGIGHGTFSVFDGTCGMNWQDARPQLRQATAQAISVRNILRQVGPLHAAPFFKVDVDGGEVGIVQMLLQVIEERSTDQLIHLPELYFEISPHFWPAFNQSLEAGFTAFKTLASYYSEIYFFHALATSCEGAGQKVLQYTTAPDKVPERPISARPKLRVLRVLDFAALLRECIAHDVANAHTWGIRGRHPIMGQMNIWFVPT